jgi:hypothetical protein
MRWKNRVTLCNYHHLEVHHIGVSNEIIEKLQKERMMFLVTIGRKDYV